MKPYDYLEKEKISLNAFAIKAGIKQPTLWRIFNKKVTNPRFDTVQKIKAASNNQITEKDIY